MSKWYVICESNHTAVDSFTDGVKLLNELVKQNPTKTVRLMDSSEYAIWEGRKRKRGKNS